MAAVAIGRSPVAAPPQAALSPPQRPFQRRALSKPTQLDGRAQRVAGTNIKRQPNTSFIVRDRIVGHPAQDRFQQVGCGQVQVQDEARGSAGNGSATQHGQAELREHPMLMWGKAGNHSDAAACSA